MQSLIFFVVKKKFFGNLLDHGVLNLYQKSYHKSVVCAFKSEEKN